MGLYIRTEKGIRYDNRESDDGLELESIDTDNMKADKNILKIIEPDDLAVMYYGSILFRKFLTTDDILDLKMGIYRLVKIITKEELRDIGFNLI